jgi:MFS family permease
MFALQAAGFAATPIAGHLSDRMGRRSIMIASMGMTAVVLLFHAMAGKSTGVHRVHRGAGLLPLRDPPGDAGMAPGDDAEEHGRHQHRHPFGAQALGSSVAPLIAGVIADRFGLLAVFWFLAATIIFANLFILLDAPGSAPFFAV